MNRSAKQAKGLFLSVAVLWLAACAPYRQAVYYPAAASYPVYGGGTVITQRSYYGAYPPSYLPAPYPVYKNYDHDHDDHAHHDHPPVIYHANPPWPKEGRLKAEPDDRHPRHSEPEYPQWGKREPVNDAPDRSPRYGRKEPRESWNGADSNPGHQPAGHPYGRPRQDAGNYGQNRPLQGRNDRNNSNDNRPRFDNPEGNGAQTVRHEPPNNQRDHRRKDPQQRFAGYEDH